MGLNICPYYYKDGISNEKTVYFEHCHKPKDDKECPNSRKDNECKVLTLTFENVVVNVDAINRMAQGYIKSNIKQ